MRAGRDSQTVSGARCEAVLFTAARGLFESLSVPGSLLAPAARHLTPVVGKFEIECQV